ncbi:hypothetical protein [Streptomyces griseorubiginosus]|uniref:Uncharacterized protein n=1 Tax=Streptomyces griseorubiginosus TaxID=67304 RepID=A0A101S116_9ACTN|nr:hypothetical protein [Streptomyces griseorubiginosus]KUN65372.1 hypothetical protein AQJ54_21360 [Streptomyces griseorubiginosus]
MSSTPTADSTAPSTVWLARGRHLGSDAADVLRRSLARLKESAVIDDFKEPSGPDDAPERIFEARWRVGDEVTVRARLSLSALSSGSQEWVLVAEAEQPWDLRWPSPATMFWPENDDVFWDRDAATGLRLRDLSVLPEDDKEVRRVLRQAVRGSWAVQVVVHEAMTPGQGGRRPLADMLPPGLRHRVVEHRAQPHQLRVLNWAVKEFGVEVPRGGAVVLPGTPVPPGYDGQDYAVRTVFLDGSEPTELLAAVTRYASMPKPLPEGGEAAVTALREQWQLLTLQEELERERALVAMYAEALEAMTKSRDLYREAAERANEALAIYRENAPASPETPADPQAGSPLQQLSKTFERWKGTLRPTAREEDPDQRIG